MNKYVANFQLVEDGDMGETFESEIIDMSYMDNIGLQVQWTNNSSTDASKVIQDLTYTADTAGRDGNDISLTYVDPGSASQAIAVNVAGDAIEVSLATSAAVAASKIIQDLTYTADTAGVAGNGISVRYINPVTPGTPLSVSLVNTNDIEVTLQTSLNSKASLVEQDLTYVAQTEGTSGNSISVTYVAPSVAGTALALSVVGNALSVQLGSDSTAIAATGSLNLTNDITLTSVAAGTARNTNTFTTQVLAAAANPTDTILVAFTGTAAAIVCTVTPNDGTNNGATPVNLTTAELAELITTGAVVGKTVTITDASSFRILQTATGGGAQNLADGGEGDGVVATFSGGLNFSPTSTATLVAALINASTAANKLVSAYVSGTGSDIQVAFGPTSLSGGALSKVVSTAAQIKTLLDATTGVAALVNISVSGTGSNIQVPQDATSLENGSAYNFTSTAAQIKTAVDANVSAAALVDIVVSGTGTNVQTEQDETFLEGGNTGAVVGVISVQGSNNWDKHLQTGSFFDITFNPALTQPNNNSSSYGIDLNQWSWKYYRVKYTATSGDGVLNVWASQKTV